ncbi:TlpA family protein disulfide reductase [Bartonella sp. B30(2025)]
MTSQIFNNFRKKGKKTQFFLILLVIVCLYAAINYIGKKVFFTSHFMSETTEQAQNLDKTQEERIMEIKKASKGFFTHIQFANASHDMRQLSFQDIQGKDHKLAEFSGKPMLINLWAIWCAPCRTEMPELAQLKREMGGDNFDVMAINVDKVASFEKIQKFLYDAQANNLVYYRDSTMNIFKNVGRIFPALGLPVTFLIDKNGYLIASLNGAAPWGNDDAKALIKAVIKNEK